MIEPLVAPTHVDLLEQGGIAVLSTIGRGGDIQSSVIWFDHHQGLIRVNTTETSVKARNLARDPRATVVVLDLTNTDRYLTLRCTLERAEREGAIEHLDRLTRANMDADRWYGGAVADDPEERARRVILCLRPQRVYVAS
ncbi:MAG: TIGR03618 family F420-dependent PPOX class oxidoreductase [Ectothiorhodospiraceae bacterium]|nr:TIGR03618 family F420-dependent PPOX class oxidoreductase [Ectothiorhodospiraceae bacterium]